VRYPDDWDGLEAGAEEPGHEPGCLHGDTPGVMIYHRSGSLCSLCRGPWGVVLQDGEETYGFCCTNPDCENYEDPDEFVPVVNLQEQGMAGFDLRGIPCYILKQVQGQWLCVPRYWAGWVEEQGNRWLASHEEDLP